MGENSIIVWSDASLSITHSDTLSLALNIHLLDVLVVPHLTKKLLFICKLMPDFPLSFTFTNNFFTI